MEIRGVTKHFGGVKAVDNFSMDLEKGKILGLIGPNCAGKTTLVNLVNGVDEPDEGEIYFDGELINGLKPYQIAQREMGERGR